ncbi:MAG: hypothetical protein M3552_09010 [Planctomycetota bacterium]|nr:hypothetical protein [Planctomycetaceae bacterium]MDQ3330778.1 hypothetical protein [Planctomycetota bacterium]
MSLPVLFAAVGRRLGYPLFFVVAMEHMFLRWEEPGERFNIECTSPGFEPLDDEHYLTSPKPLTEQDLATGLYLRNLTPREELAECFMMRGACLFDHLRVQEAMECGYRARLLVPNNRRYDGFSVITTMLWHLLEGERNGTGPTYVPENPYQQQMMNWAIENLQRVRFLHARNQAPEPHESAAADDFFAALAHGELSLTD